MSLFATVSLQLKVYIFRLLASINVFLDRNVSIPLPPNYNFKISIPSSLRKQPGQIELLFYTPPGFQRQHKYPLVVNFHGGGYTIGGAADDARWAQHVTNQLNAVFVSVEYGLAPEHPFPVGIGDGVDAICWLWKHAEEYDLDSSQTMTTGFSAGGTLSLAVPLRLHEALNEHRDLNADGRITGIVAFYPGVDWTQERAERTASNPISATKGSIPPFLFEMFDQSYLGPEGTRPDGRSPYLSPGRAESSLLREALPESIALYSCEWDQLLVEDEAFRERLRGLGKKVSGSTVQEVPHGWDKKPTLWHGDAKRDNMYENAVQQMLKQ